MLTTQPNNLRAAPTATVADLQDVLADRARSHHDMVVPAGQLRFNPDIGMLEVQGRGEYALRSLALSQNATKLGVPRRLPAQVPVGAACREHQPLALVCSPKTGPDVMRVRNGMEAGKDCHETQTSNPQTSHRAAA